MKRLLILLLLLSGATSFGAEWIDSVDGETFGTSSSRFPDRGGGVFVQVAFGWHDVVELFEGTTKLGSYRNPFSISGSHAFRLFFGDPGIHILHATLTRGNDGSVSGSPPVTIRIVSPPPAPTLSPQEPRPVTHNRASLSCIFENHGVDFEEAYFEYGLGLSYGQIAGGLVSKDTNRKTATVNLSGLTPGTTYHWRYRLRTSAGVFSSADSLFTTALNRAPVAFSQTLMVYPEPGFARWSLGIDPDGDDLTLVSLGNPTHGSAELDNSGTSITGFPPYRGIRYTPGPTFNGRDSITYTIADPYGAETTGTVTIRDFNSLLADVDGSYATVLTLDERVIGPLTLSITPGGSFTGSFTYFGERHSFRGSISAYGSAQIEVPRYGKPPFSLNLGFSYAGENVQLGGSLYEGNDQHTIVAAPKLVDATVSIPETGQFNAVFPAPTGTQTMRTGSSFAASVLDSGKPQGHGYAVMRLRKTGHLKVTGRLGDNVPFSLGARMRVDRQVMVLGACSFQRKGLLHGLVAFGAPSGADAIGNLSWYNPERPSGPYASGFTIPLEAKGERFVTGSRALPGSPSGTLLHFALGDRSGGSAFQTTSALTAGNQVDASTPDGTRVRLRISPRSGLFTGTFKRPSKRTENLKGILQPGRGSGAGVFGRPGEDAAIELNIEK